MIIPATIIKSTHELTAMARCAQASPAPHVAQRHGDFRVPQSSSASRFTVAQQLRQLGEVHRNPPRLVLGEVIGASITKIRRAATPMSIRVSISLPATAAKSFCP